MPDTLFALITLAALTVLYGLVRLARRLRHRRDTRDDLMAVAEVLDIDPYQRNSEIQMLDRMFAAQAVEPDRRQQS